MTPEQIRRNIRGLRMQQERHLRFATEIQEQIDAAMVDLPGYKPYGGISTMDAVQLLVGVHTYRYAHELEIKLDVREIAVQGREKLQYKYAWVRLRRLCGVDR